MAKEMAGNHPFPNRKHIKIYIHGRVFHYYVSLYEDISWLKCTENSSGIDCVNSIVHVSKNFRRVLKNKLYIHLHSSHNGHTWRIIPFSKLG